jgi:hypothetical protein
MASVSGVMAEQIGQMEALVLLMAGNDDFYCLRFTPCDDEAMHALASHGQYRQWVFGYLTNEIAPKIKI